MFCSTCRKESSRTDKFCIHCGKPLVPGGSSRPTGRGKPIPGAWIEEKTELLKTVLPRGVQLTPFYPDDIFYLNYHADPLAALRYKATVIFSLLNIEPDGCIIDFCEEQKLRRNLSPDTAGLYTRAMVEDGREREVILINSKYRADTLAVGAILAHEMMHLYLYRLNLKLEDTFENELLTDLATINTGLSILILNGMSYSSQWWLTIIMAMFGGVYFREEKKGFGYFKPDEYGRHASVYFTERNIPTRTVVSFMSPRARHFFPKAFSLKRTGGTELIRRLEKEYWKSNIIKGAVAAVVVIPILVFGLWSEGKKLQLEERIKDCKADVTLLEAKVDIDSKNLKQIDKELSRYKENGDVENYNRLVEPYNDLLKQLKDEIPKYKASMSACNGLIDEYNDQ